jgi:hypothetical protein
MIVNGLILAGFLVGFLGLLLVLAIVMWLVERYVPGAHEWLDRHVGEERQSDRAW